MVACLGLVLGILIIELVLGGWLRPDPLERLGILRSRMWRFDVSTLYPRTPPVISYTRDRYGLRGRHTSPRDIEVLTLGGSTTDQRFLADGETWQDVLEGALGRGGVEVTVANAGVDGQSTVGHQRDFLEWFPLVPGLKPRWVIFYVGLNDLLSRAARDYDDVVKPGSLRALLQERSALVWFARKARGAWEARFGRRITHQRVAFQSVRWVKEPLLVDHQALLESALLAYEKRLTALARSAAALGATPVFVTQTTRLFRKDEDGTVVGRLEPLRLELLGPEGDRTVEANGVDVARLLGGFNERTLDVATRVGAVSVDLAREAAFSDEDFYDFMHTTPSGARKIGELLAARLAPVMAAAGAP